MTVYQAADVGCDSCTHWQTRIWATVHVQTHGCWIHSFPEVCHICRPAPVSSIPTKCSGNTGLYLDLDSRITYLSIRRLDMPMQVLLQQQWPTAMSFTTGHFSADIRPSKTDEPNFQRTKIWGHAWTQWTQRQWCLHARVTAAQNNIHTHKTILRHLYRFT